MTKYTKAEQDEVLVGEVVNLISGYVPNRTNVPQAMWRALEATAVQVIELVRKHDSTDG